MRRLADTPAAGDDTSLTKIGKTRVPEGYEGDNEKER